MPEPEPEFVYLATPYNHPNFATRYLRFAIVTKAAAELVQAGYHVYSPITHNHPVAESNALPLHAIYWAAVNERILTICQRLIVLQQPGWRESVGVRAEIAFAEVNDIPISYMNMEGELRDEPEVDSSGVSRDSAV